MSLKQGEGPTVPATGTPGTQQQQQQLPSSVAPAPHTHQFAPNQQSGGNQGRPPSQQPPSLMNMPPGTLLVYIISPNVEHFSLIHHLLGIYTE